MPLCQSEVPTLCEGVNKLKKVLIVRGHRLNKWEMQNYEPLMPRYNISGIASCDHRFPLEEISFPVSTLHSWREIVGHVPKVRGLFNIITRDMPSRDKLLGLESHLAGADIVHSVETHRDYMFSYQAASLKRKHKYKLVITQWENIPFAYEDVPGNSRIKAIVRSEADHFIAISQRSKGALMTEGVPENKISVINYGIDLASFFPREKNCELLQRFHLAAEDFVVLYVGRLVWEKGIYEILLALRKLLNARGKTDRRICAVFVGSGEESSGIRRMISDLSLDQNVFLASDVPYRLIPDVHGIADVFVMPSVPIRTLREQFGMVLIEAMAAGKPVISTYCGSIPEIVGDAGLLVSPADHLSLCEAITALLDNPELRKQLSQKGRSRAIERFDCVKTAGKIGELYDKLLANG